MLSLFGKVRRIRTWKQAALSITVVWALTFSTIVYQQQSVLIRVLLPSIPTTPTS